MIWWKVYRINGTFEQGLERIGCFDFKNDDLTIFQEHSFVYAWFDDDWSIGDDSGYGYGEFKGTVSIKEFRKQKIKKLENESSL